ncbi:nucleotidyltransferase family protein [Nocardia sp. NPDC051832]|uniref:nucleotidyltransferase family protein n=1 Tax=Nocardia sp. NPDC051832 TaxID=3155673 RepID=UPI003449657E
MRFGSVPPAALGIVLAAGAGKRYGYPKALADNGAWLHRAATALRAGGCDAVLVLLGATGPAPQTVAIPEGAQPLWVPDWARGLSASLRTGLATAAKAGAEYAVIMPVDTPDVGPDTVARVLTAARDTPGGLARAVFHHTPGHPVALSRNHWAPIYAAAEGDSGARAYLTAHPGLTLVRCDDLATGIDHDYRPRDGSVSRSVRCRG